MTPFDRLVARELWNYDREAQTRRIISTPHSTMSVRDDRTEIPLLGPKGELLRVLQYEGGRQVEHGDHLHAVVRPSVRLKVRAL